MAVLYKMHTRIYVDINYIYGRAETDISISYPELDLVNPLE